MVGLKYKIILISRRDALCDAIRSLLQLSIGEDAELDCFSSFTRALQEAPLPTYDLLLLEADEKVESRLEKLRLSSHNGSVVVLTETADHELGLACIGAGAQDYVTLEEISPGSLFRTLRFAIERRKVQQALESSQAQLSQAQKMEAIGRMASGLAHDFRQYIQVIVGNSKVLQRLCRDDETIAQLVQDIAQAGFGASELVGQVLDFARQGPVEMKELELNKVLKSNRAMVESFGKGVKIQVETSPYPLKINGDPVQLGQIILNLAINAVDACEKHGLVQVFTGQLHLERRYNDESLVLEPGNYATIQVRDSGSGIPVEVRESLFDPFFTTKPRGKGTGLGLSTVYSLVKGMGGQVAFWTQVGRGTTFAVFLPCKTVPVGDPPATLDRRVGMLTKDPLERGMLRQDLKQLGCRVREFTSVEKAKNWAEKHADRSVVVAIEAIDDPSLLNRSCVLLSGLQLKDGETEATLLNKPYSLAMLAQACLEAAPVEA